MNHLNELDVKKIERRIELVEGQLERLIETDEIDKTIDTDENKAPPDLENPEPLYGDYGYPRVVYPVVKTTHPLCGVRFCIDTSSSRSTPNPYPGFVRGHCDGGAGYRIGPDNTYKNWWEDGWYGGKYWWIKENLFERARQLPLRGVWIVNIEHWPLNIRKYSDAAVETSIRKLRKIFKIVKYVRPDATVGIYSMMPPRDYWTPVNGKEDKMEEWRRSAFRLLWGRNDDGSIHQHLGLSDAVDAIFPSCYLFYNREDEDANIRTDRRYIVENVRLARRYGKPVFPFFMPGLHESSVSPDRSAINPVRWKRAMEAARDAGSSGMVFWNGTGPKTQEENKRQNELKQICLDVFGSYTFPKDA